MHSNAVIFHIEEHRRLLSSVVEVEIKELKFERIKDMEKISRIPDISFSRNLRMTHDQNRKTY